MQTYGSMYGAQTKIFEDSVNAISSNCILGNISSLSDPSNLSLPRLLLSSSADPVRTTFVISYAVLTWIIAHTMVILSSYLVSVHIFVCGLYPTVLQQVTSRMSHPFSPARQISTPDILTAYTFFYIRDSFFELSLGVFIFLSVFSLKFF